ncbi:MAG: transcription elongation factor GreA [Patescibacteria group bacterium]
MADNVTYVSAEGLAKLKAELEVLKYTRRRELADRIDAAKALGDLSENAEYHEAKEDLGFVEGRIAQIESMLKNFEIIAEGSTGEVVGVGSTVEVEINGKKKTYKIVGSNEADPVAGLISNESPLGNAFIGHQKGDEVIVEIPAGKTTYVILGVR